MSKHTRHPLETVEPAECQAPPSAERVQCPVCGKVFGGGAVVNADPLWMMPEKIRVMPRRFFCDHCAHVVCWSQELRDDGSFGERVSEPIMLTGKAAAEWLKKHPEAAGVMG